MSNGDQFIRQFQELLNRLPTESLGELQQEFRTIMFLMGNTIVTRYAAAAGGYHPIGPHRPEPILDFVNFSLQINEGGLGPN